MSSILFFIIAALQPLSSTGAILQARNTIDGSVTNSNNRPVINARVYLQNDAYSEVAATYTDGSGRFVFRNIGSGIYNVVVEAIDGTFERQSQRLDAVAVNGRGSGRGGEMFRVDFVVRPRRDDNPPKVETRPNSVFYQEVPEAAKQEYLAAVRSLEQNDFDKAAIALKQAIRLFPDYYDALDRLGSEYVRRRDFNTALPHLEQAIAVNKDAWSSYYYLGVARLELKQVNEAVEALRKAVDLNPNSINANMRLGMILATNKATYDEAIKAFRKVAELAGKQLPDAYLYLAKLYSEQKSYTEAAEALETYTKFIPASQPEQREQYRKVIEQLRHKAKS
jgi:cytochrome c-type biogenesis protein CcmH/NrfG